MRLTQFHIILLFCTFLVSCNEPEPLKIGFLGSLSGRAAEVSQSVRDGALMAIEEVNSIGGFEGRKVELVIFDDRHDQTRVKEGVNSLADARVVAILGPITSQMSATATPEANVRKIVLVSPTSSTVELSGKKDYFYRTIQGCDTNARSLAKHVIETLGARKFAVLKDESNRAFTDSWQQGFNDQVNLMGGTIVTTLAYDSLKSSDSFLNLAKQILKQNPDGILVLANSIDTAIFCQQVSKLSGHKFIMGSDWAFSGDLVEYGGHSVEGFIFTTNLDMESDAPRYKKFESDFEHRFGSPPNFPSALAFETIQLILKALSKDPDPTHLPETLIALGKVEGLQEMIQLDSFGDVERSIYINEVRDGHFVSIRKID